MRKLITALLVIGGVASSQAQDLPLPALESATDSLYYEELMAGKPHPYSFSKRSYDLEYLGRWIWMRQAPRNGPQGVWPMEARRLFDDAIAADSANFLAYFHKAEMLQDLGQWDDAQAVLEETVRRWPDDPEPYRHLAEYAKNRSNATQDTSCIYRAIGYGEAALEKVSAPKKAMAAPLYSQLQTVITTADTSTVGHDLYADPEKALGNYRLSLLTDIAQLYIDLGDTASAGATVGRAAEISPGMGRLLREIFFGE
ncbi:hypothetical protein JXB02_05015 [Candidatus Woesearchaeota archaeon]|nr:hypothetical protein [Candidatus Woesearchaeota archaeon]